MISGDISKLRELVHNLETLRDTGIREVVQEVAMDAGQLIKDEFSAETDPYGLHWAPRKDLYTHPILDKTGYMRTSFVIDTNATSIRITNLAPYSIFHQNGTSKMPARKLTPNEGEISKIWDEKFMNTINEKINKIIQGKY